MPLEAGPKLYPLSKFHYSVSWGSNEAGSKRKVDFSEISGLSAETEMIEYREGNIATSGNTKIPGKRKYSNVTLKRGMIEKDHALLVQTPAAEGDPQNTRVLSKHPNWDMLQGFNVSKNIFESIENNFR